MQGRTVLNIRTDQGGELARSSELCDMIHNEFQCGLQMTGTYSAWLNGKVERYIQTIENMERRTRMDSGLLVNLWYQSIEVAIEIYNMLYHAILQDAPDWIWDKTKRSIHDLQVWGCRIEAKIDSHVPTLNSRTEYGYYMGTTATKSVIKYWRT